MPEGRYMVHGFHKSRATMEGGLNINNPSRMYLNTVRQIILEGVVADEKCPFGVEKGGGRGA